MTTPTVTEAEALGRGWYAYRRIARSECPPGEAVREAIEGLGLALETYKDLLDDTTHPAAVYPELEHEDNALDKALSMTAQDAADWAAELDRLVPERSEDEEDRAA